MRFACFLLLIVSTGARAQGRFASAGQLSVARANHTATLLRDGRVLITGGRSVDGLKTLASCEVFDPKTSRWSLVRPLIVARSHHTATLLDDGRVLVVGGTTHEDTAETSRFVALDSVEIYQPTNNTWELAAPLKQPRNGHTASRLPDGSVLVTGGAREQRQHLSSVERFDPVTRQWLEERPLAVARWMHAAVSLKTQLVVVGGRSNTSTQNAGPGTATDAVEVYDFNTRDWAKGPPLPEPVQRMSALAWRERVLVIGGQTSTSTTNLVESWATGDPSWAAFENHLSMSLASATATALPSGDVLIIGGEAPDAIDTARSQRWVPQSHQWCLAGAMKTSRKGHTATLLSTGRVLVVGGTSSGVPERTAELWGEAPGGCEQPPGLSLGF